MVKLIYLDGEYYQLVRDIKVEQVMGNMEGLKAWRDMLHCDHVLMNKTHYLFCETVQEAEVIEYL